MTDWTWTEHHCSDYNDVYDNLRTSRFQQPLLVKADEIYREIWDVAEIHRLDDKRQGDKIYPNILDKHLGIDGYIKTENGTVYSFQEKFRKYKWAKKNELTIETANGDGTAGEWQKLNAEYYFYAYANRSGDGLTKWILLNVIELKNIIDAAGGIRNVGKEFKNVEYGSATFRAIPFPQLKKAIVKSFGIEKQEKSEFSGDNLKRLQEMYRKYKTVQNGNELSNLIRI